MDLSDGDRSDDDQRYRPSSRSNTAVVTSRKRRYRTIGIPRNIDEVS